MVASWFCWGQSKRRQSGRTASNGQEPLMLLSRVRVPGVESGSSLSHVLTLLSWVTVSQAVSFGMMLVLARLYSPAQFGLFALFTNASVMLGVVAALRYEYAIVLPSDSGEADSIVWLALATAGGISVLTLIVGW